MEQKKYNEFTVQIDNGKIVQKMPTLRKSVMIYEHEAERLNNVVRQTKTYYELAEEKKIEKVEPIKAEIKPESLANTKEFIKPEELKKDLTLEKLKGFEEEELNAVLSVTSKAQMLELVGIEFTKQKLNLTSHPDCIKIVKEKLNELKKEIK